MRPPRVSLSALVTAAAKVSKVGLGAVVSCAAGNQQQLAGAVRLELYVLVL